MFVAIEEEYNGPALEDGKVTLKFVTDLMETYKNQGKLHRKYAYKVSFKIIYIVNLTVGFLTIVSGTITASQTY